MSLGTQWAVDWVMACSAAASQHRVELIELDRAIGDADHGDNLDRGFHAVASKLANTAFNCPGDVLKMVATTLLSTVGGAAGPLYGTVFLRAGKCLGYADLDEAGAVAMLESALCGLQARGKAGEGEKTMVDAWAPALRAAQEAYSEGGSVEQILEAAAQAAQGGAESTVPMVASKGRASYLGERSVGHMDPGARSTAIILQKAAEVAAK